MLRNNTDHLYLRRKHWSCGYPKGKISIFSSCINEGIFFSKARVYQITPKRQDPPLPCIKLSLEWAISQAAFPQVWAVFWRAGVETQNFRASKALKEEAVPSFWNLESSFETEAEAGEINSQIIQGIHGPTGARTQVPCFPPYLSTFQWTPDLSWAPLANSLQKYLGPHSTFPKGFLSGSQFLC